MGWVGSGSYDKGFQNSADAVENALGRRHAARGVAAIHQPHAGVGGRGVEVDAAHGALQRQRRLVDVLRAPQIAAVGPFALLGELALDEGERHVEEERHVGARDGVAAVFEVEDPVAQPPPLAVAAPEAGALVGDIRPHVAVEHHGPPLGEPRADRLRRIGPVAREEERHEVGIDRIGAAELAPQEAGDQLAVYGRIETREMEVLALHAPLCQHAAQQRHLCRFTGSVQPLDYYEHRLFGLDSRF